MGLAGLATIEHHATGVAASAADDPVDQPGPGPAVALGPAVLVAAGTALVLALVALAVRLTAEDTPSDDVAVGMLAQLPVLLVLGAGAHLGRRARSPLEALTELGTRAATAEAALVREHDRMHELRATLAGVSAAYRVLQDPRTTLDPARMRRLQELHDLEMERLERLLADRRDTARTVDLDAVIGPLVESLRVRGIAVTWTESGCSAHGRADDVTEVVHVLLENAAQHAAGHAVEVAVIARGREVDVRVADRGPGIPPDLLPRLFERGSRGADSSGHGLGLAIAHRLTQEMGGRLAPPRVGAPGATFVLSLPAHSGGGSCPAASD